ncbi:hypothetical protein RSOL_348290 [Rhizoctonia solani AG-3 Rhs1AP]|uniref:Uncharacterized protein n=1 Tax=Rhizoctonia solani AG-3 Rhs1AP TaxID=1086054 RepID=X8JB31_9AGAM|nr:hypothetical protein RSOL_348290 [Rhizoctonia solani AG-3 Rhs1AP]
MRGGNDTVLSSAESEPDDYATLPRSKAMLASANASEKAKQDDGVHAITGLFGNLTFGHPKEYEGGARREPVGERLVSLIEPSINKKGESPWCTQFHPILKDEEEESAHRKSGSSLVQRQGAECVSPASASDNGDSSPRTEDDFKSSLSEKDQVKASSTGCQPQGPQPSKYHPTTPKQDREPTVDLVESASDGIAAAQPGAHSSQEGSDHLTPKATPLALPNVEEDEQDGTVHCIIDGLGHITLEGTQNPADDIKPKLEQEKRVQPPSLRIDHEGQAETEEPEGSGTSGSVPQTPCSRGDQNYHHFRTSSGWHCFDDYRNVYAEDGTLVHDASFELDGSDPNFYIHEVPYWMSPNGLSSIDADIKIYCVRTWTNKYYFHTSSGWYFFDDYHNVYLEDGTLVHGSSFSAEVGELRSPAFYIDGASYWFVLDVLWCQASTDTFYCVHTWKSEPGRSLNKLYCFFASDQFYHLDIRRNLHSKDGTLVYDASSSPLADKLHIPNFHIDGTPYWLHKDGLLSRSADGAMCRVLAWVEDLYSFHTPNGLHYFDRHRNVYSDKGIRVHNRSHYAKSDGVTPLIFQVDGDSYWFELGALWCQVSTCTRYRVHTWQREPTKHSPGKKYCFFTSGHFYYLDNRRNVHSEDGTLFYNGSSSSLTYKLHKPNFHIGNTPYWLHKDGLLSRSADDTMCRVLAWVLNDNLEKVFERGLVPFSPDPSSSSKSPNIIESTADGRETPDTSLFAESDPSYIQGKSTSSQHKTAKKATKKAQPVRKRGTKDHLLCPLCGKKNRRPVALEVSVAVTG